MLVRSLVLALGLVLMAASPALAYVGPGVGLSAIGAALAFVGAMVLAVVGFIWYPIKRLLLRGRARKTTQSPSAS